MNDLVERLEALQARGVHLPDPRQVFLGPEVRIERIAAGVVLHPGTRLHGVRTFLGPNAIVGAEGPAVLVDTVLSADARVQSGYVEGAVLLDGASLGANAHVRPGTLLEEQASTGHAVGLKQTLLLAFVTLGSLINFCDVLMSGGTSRDDHSEVGSGFIHFNFTPWGERGDKATPSLIGDVARGVLLRERRIFLGGAGGLVGPQNVGFGSVTAAGQVVRREVPDEALVLEAPRAVSRRFRTGALDALEPRASKNLAYLGEVSALHAFYRHVRRPRTPCDGPLAYRRVVVDEALATLEAHLDERERRLRTFVEERGYRLVRRGGLETAAERGGGLADLVGGPLDELAHIAWIRSRSPDEVTRLGDWLRDRAVEARAQFAIETATVSTSL